MHDETQVLSDLEPSTPSSFASNHLEMACIVEKGHLKTLLGSTLILPEMHIGQAWNKGKLAYYDTFSAIIKLACQSSYHKTSFIDPIYIYKLKLDDYKNLPFTSHGKKQRKGTNGS